MYNIIAQMIVKISHFKAIHVHYDGDEDGDDDGDDAINSTSSVSSKRRRPCCTGHEFARSSARSLPPRVLQRSQS